MGSSNLNSERNKLLTQIIKVSEIPLFILSIIWLALLIAELTGKSSSLLETAGIYIWVIFILDFILKFFVAPSKLRFLRRNFLTIISLIVPAFRILRVFRIFRLIRLSRSLSLVKVIGSFNRGMRSLANTLHKRAVFYVVLLSVIVVLLGAAGMYAFEKDVNPGFKTYGNSLWWTAMLVMSMGTENWPLTNEGRVMCMLVVIYGLAVFGYITATIATFFIGKDADDSKKTLSANTQWQDIQKELQAIKDEIGKLKNSHEH